MKQLLIVLVFAASAVGCAWMPGMAPVAPALPERIYTQPLGTSYRDSSVGIFAFQSPPQAPFAGRQAADVLFEQLLRRNVFHRLFQPSAEEGLSFEEQLALARAKGMDLIIIGTVDRYLTGSLYQASEVREQIRVVHVASRAIVWYAEATATGRPVEATDWIFFVQSGRPAPSPAELMRINADKFCTLFVRHPRG